MALFQTACVLKALLCKYMSSSGSFRSVFGFYYDWLCLIILLFSAQSLAYCLSNKRLLVEQKNDTAEGGHFKEAPDLARNSL